MKRKTDNFNKFFNKKRNSAIKEEFRQEKKAAKKERKEAIERHFEEKRKSRYQQEPPVSDRHALPPGGRSGFKGRGTGKDDFRDSPGAKGKVQAAKGPGTAKGGSHHAAAAGPDQHASVPHDPNLIPLNKYIAHGGVCSRRDAADLIRQGQVQVNGNVVTEPGTKVSPSDLVHFNGKKVTISRNFVYILLNKPKDYITTNEDPQGRRTVLDLIRQATTERVFPVGRLDRNTSGVLLLTNDGDLAQKLAHPKHEIKKIYHVTLDKPLTKADFDSIIGGSIMLEDGPAVVDVLAYADTKDKTQIGLEIHSGRNRIVRRIFEHLGYDVRGLDRVTYAGLTKKNVQRGHWRLLTEKEIRILKYLNSSFKGSPGKGAKATRRDQEAQAAKGGAAAWDEPAAAAPVPDKIAAAKSAGSGTGQSKGAYPKAGRPNPAKAAADDEGWQDPADIDWENPAGAAASWEDAAGTAWDAQPNPSKPDPSANRIAKRDVDRYTKDQMARKFPGKKKPPTTTLKESSNEITAADRDFADRKGYSGEKKTSDDRRPSTGKNFSSNRRGPKGRSFGNGKPPYQAKDAGWDEQAPEERAGGKPPHRGRPGSGEGKPPYRGKSGSAEGRPPFKGKTPYSGRPTTGEGKPPYRGKSSDGDKPPYRGKSSASGKPFRGNGKPAPAGKNFSSDKAPYKGKSSAGDKPSFRGKSTPGDKPPVRGKSAGGEGRPPYKGKPASAGKGKGFSSDKAASPRGKSSFRGKSASAGGSTFRGKTGRPSSSRPSKGRNTR